MVDSTRVYIALSVALGAIISPKFSEATGPTNPVSWPVSLGRSAFVFCAPFHREILRVREAGWWMYNPKHDNWTYLLGIDRTRNQTDSWHNKSGFNGSRYSLYGPNKSFLKIDNVTAEDIGTEFRCTIDNYKESIHVKLTKLFVDPEEGILCPTTTPPTTTTQPSAVVTFPTTTPDSTTTTHLSGHNPSEGSHSCPCTSWKTGCIIISLLLFIAVLAPVIIYMYCQYSKETQALKDDEQWNVTYDASTGHHASVDNKNGTETHYANIGEKFNSLAVVVDDDDDDPMLNP